jgi:hypothetical protein
MILYTYQELSAEAQKKARNYYIIEAILEDINEDLAHDILSNDLTGDRYNERGELLLSGEE